MLLDLLTTGPGPDIESTLKEAFANYSKGATSILPDTTPSSSTRRQPVLKSKQAEAVKENKGLPPSPSILQRLPHAKLLEPWREEREAAIREASNSTDSTRNTNLVDLPTKVVAPRNEAKDLAVKSALASKTSDLSSGDQTSKTSTTNTITAGIVRIEPDCYVLEKEDVDS